MNGGGEKRLVTISTALSIALLFILVSSIPGLTFSLSSSVTSYNNTITVIGQQVDPPEGFNTISKTIEGQTAIEIVAKDTESFVGNGWNASNSAEVTVYANKIAIYLQFDGSVLANGSSKITVTVNADSSDKQDFGPATFEKTFLDRLPSEGFLQISGENASLVNTGFTEFETSNGKIIVDITCKTVYLPIHVSIVILS